MWALGILSERMARRMADSIANPDVIAPPSDTDLWRLVDAGQKMAAVVARSKIAVSGPSLEGFRAGAGGLPSARVGDSRVRSVEGERRPVRDRGRADREAYNRKARERGDTEL